MLHFILSAFIFLLPKTLLAKNTIPDGFNHNKPLTISVLSEKEINNLYEDFLQTSNELFKDDENVCHIRATELAQRAEKKNIILGKIFARGKLRVAPQGSRKQQSFDWHVALVVYVRTPDQKDLQLKVLDPQFFKNPVSVEEWKQMLLAPASKANEDPSRIAATYFGSRFQYRTEIQEKKKYQWNKNDLKDIEEYFKETKKPNLSAPEKPAPSMGFD